jgi:hypothetical protein
MRTRNYKRRTLMTPGRRAWLERLADGPARRPPHSRAATDCSKLDWSQPVYERAGVLASREHVRALGYDVAIREAGWKLSTLECLTDLGRTELALAKFIDLEKAKRRRERGSLPYTSTESRP